MFSVLDAAQAARERAGETAQSVTGIRRRTESEVEVAQEQSYVFSLRTGDVIAVLEWRPNLITRKISSKTWIRTCMYLSWWTLETLSTTPWATPVRVLYTQQILLIWVQ